MLIKVRVITRSEKYKIMRKSADTYLIYVKETPENGQANIAVKQILGEYFRTAVHTIRLVKGGKQPNKIFMVP